ncbi:hypothetical protein [Paucibacter soli]|uniref:hypothetical protein n=1 Tax=Paucibacter soli TaxID=3133433 RepID=UPI0030B092DF
MQLRVDAVLFEYEQPLIVAAMDDVGRRFVGVAYGPDLEGLDQSFVFIEASAEQLADFTSGAVDLRSVIDEREGMVLTGVAEGNAGDLVDCQVTAGVPAQARPGPGLVLPAEVVRVVSGQFVPAA